jgi:hypothetical protein
MLGRLEALSGTRRGAVLLFVGALAVYGLESLAVPLFEGRDLGTYAEYYDQLFHGVALPMLMLYRMPIAPLVIGPALDFLGGAGTQVVMGVLFAVTVVCWGAAAAELGRRVAIFVAIALALDPSFGIFFHRIASDQIFAVGFALWALGLVRATRRPTTGRFALIGLGVVLLTLIRPGNQVLIVFALLPLTLRLPWRLRLVGVAAFVATAAAGLGVWSVYNGLRFDDYTIARGANAFLPFYRVFSIDRIVRPENGPASRELARAVDARLLTKEPYRSYGVTEKLFFERADARMFEDVVNLSDQVWGWDSDYSKLRAVALEAVEKHPVTYAKGVLHTLDLEGRGVEVYYPALFAPGPVSTAAPTVVVTGRRLPQPTEGSLIPSARMGFSSATPDGRIQEVWTSPTAHRLVFRNPAEERRYEDMWGAVGRLTGRVPTYAPIDVLRRVLNLLARLYPRNVVWLFVGLVSVLVRRPKAGWIAFAPTLAGLIVILVNALAIYAILDFAMPFLPAFILLAAVGLVGERRLPGATRVS